jgi:hypothetical protein
MALCSGIKANGERCRAQAMRDSQWCLNHHPDRAEENRRRGSKGGKRGGRGRKQVELSGIKSQLQDLADGVLDGSIERADASVASQILNVLLRAITVELQVKEQLELIERLEALEDAEEARKRTTWGA